MKVIVQRAFWDLRRSNCYIIDRDFESKKHRYSANSYLEVLNAEVEPIFEDLDEGYMFMQDNASIHTTYKVRDQFIKQRIITITDWPPYSLDLNLIEHIQQHLKVQTYEMFLEVAADKSESEYARQRLESCIQAVQDTLDQSLFDNLGASMHDRYEAVIAVDRQYTKY